MKPWFDVDKDGLAKLLADKGKETFLFELVQNCWDENTALVTVMMRRVAHSPFVQINVRDDNPGGFANLADAYTLFAESKKKGDAEKRGRFNLGEKLVIAMCRDARIITTTGCVEFSQERGREFKTTVKTEVGSEFIGTIRMTDAEMRAVIAACDRLLPPEHIETYINERQIVAPKIALSFRGTLATEIANDEGVLSKTQRVTTIRLYRAQGQAYLYEMGIPIVEIEGLCHVNVMQKVPLAFNRDNVTPAYLARIYALVLERTAHVLDADEANQAWVREAMQTNPDLLSDNTVSAVMDRRFGTKRVSFDPSDPEANKLAVSLGYTVVHGSMLSGVEWDAARRAQSILPAGKVTPSARAYGDGPSVKVIEPSEYTPGMKRTVAFAKWFGENVVGLGSGVTVKIVHTTNNFAAAYGGRCLDLNLLRLGHQFFDGDLEQIIDILIHEFGHEYESDHLSANYYRALTRIGAQATMAALASPGAFTQFELSQFKEVA